MCHQVSAHVLFCMGLYSVLACHLHVLGVVNGVLHVEHLIKEDFDDAFNMQHTVQAPCACG